MINFQGIVKPSYHAYRFLHELGDEQLLRLDQGIVTRRSGDGRLRGAVFHYPPEVPNAVHKSTEGRARADEELALGQPRELLLNLTDLPAGSSLEIEILDRDHGNVITAWRAMGCPQTPTREQTAALQGALATHRQLLLADGAGRLQAKLTIQPWSVVLLRQL